MPSPESPVGSLAIPESRGIPGLQGTHRRGSCHNWQNGRGEQTHKGLGSTDEHHDHEGHTTHSTQTHRNTHRHTETHTYKHTDIHTDTHSHRYIQAHIKTHIFTDTHTDTHTNTQRQTCTDTQTLTTHRHTSMQLQQLCVTMVSTHGLNTYSDYMSVTKAPEQSLVNGACVCG